MKEHTKGIITGTITTALILGITTTALAATGQLTITVDPINIQVNGETFQPKDAQGADVLVFAYNGTTYAPLRALAEAYGLEVGYDAQNNMATVGAKAGDDVQPTTTPAPDTTVAAADYSDWTAEEEAAYQEFKGLWELEITEVQTSNVKNIILNCKEENLDKLQTFISDKSVESIQMYCQRNGAELYQENRISTFLYNIPNMRWIWSDDYKDGDWLLGYSQYWHDVIIQM